VLLKGAFGNVAGLVWLEMLLGAALLELDLAALAAGCMMPGEFRGGQLACLAAAVLHQL
jgi:hypothetical protein